MDRFLGYSLQCAEQGKRGEIHQFPLPSRYCSDELEYITYATPNKAARELIEDESIRNSRVLFPEAEDLQGSETFQFLGDEADSYYNELWNKVKSK